MSDLPRVARIRQAAAAARQNKLADNAMQGDAERRDGMFARYDQRTRPGGGGVFSGRFASTNRVARDTSQDIITAKEWDEMVQKREESGKIFRVLFGIACAVVMLLLFFAKYDLEVNLEMPQIEYGTGFGEVKDYEEAADTTARHAGGAAGSVSEVSGAEMEHLYSVLGVKGRLQKPTRPTQQQQEPDEGKQDNAAAGEAPRKAKYDPDKERRRDNYRVRQELKAAYQKHQEGIGQLVHCGRSCEAKNQQVELAYTALASQIDRPLETVLFDKAEQRKKRSWAPSELKETFAKKMKEIEETETDEEDRAMAVEELKDAFDILSNHEATTYMRLVGRKPPTYMKHVSQRDGGWGEKLQTGQYKNRLIFAWLDYFNNPWVEVGLLVAIALFMLARLPAALKQTQALVEQLEWEESVQAAERKANAPAETDKEE
jgi:hypothetical protein